MIGTKKEANHTKSSYLAADPRLFSKVQIQDFDSFILISSTTTTRILKSIVIIKTMIIDNTSTMEFMFI